MMRGFTALGRLGGMAIALGVGAAIAGAGAGTAWADTRGDPARPDTTASESASRPDPGRSRSAQRESAPTPKDNRPRSARRAAAPAATVWEPVLRVEPRATTDLTPAAAATPLAVVPESAPVIAAMTAPIAPVAEVSRAMAASPAIAGAIRSLAAALFGSGPLQPAGPVESPLSWAVAAAARREPGVAAAIASATAAATGNPILTFLFNQTPTLNPARIGQDSASVVTGDLNINDPDSDVEVYTVDKQPVNGTVTIDTDGKYTYVPDPFYARAGTTDTFTVTVSDAESGFHIHGLGGLLNLLTFGLLGDTGHASTSTVTVVVDPRNEAPVGTVSIGGTDPVNGRVVGRVTGTDADGDPLT